MRHLYHPSALDPARPVGSLWEETAGPAPAPDPLDGPASADVAIVGAGYTGLSAALHLARDHGADVRVLEAATPGWGASGRNGGFCVPGAAKLGWAAMIRRHGLEAARAFHAAQGEAPGLVRDLLDSEGIEAEPTGEAEICVAHRPGRMHALAAEARFLEATFGEPAALLDRDALAARGIAGPEVHGGLAHPGRFGLHPMRYARGLLAAARRHGARVHGHTPVTGWRGGGRGHLLETPAGAVEARCVIVATNGYTPEDLHPGLAGRLMPALSGILVTRPLTAEERAAQGWTATDLVFDTRRLLHYVRLLPCGRFLFGGRGGLDASPRGLARRRRAMERRFRAFFPAWAHVEFTHFWAGFVCLAADLVPHVAPLDRDGTAWCGLAYHGNGVAGATWTGRLLARILAGAESPEAVPEVMRGPPPRFPLPGLRKSYLRAAYGAYALADARP